jgi:putative spermidine/putrescine transport system permease protein
MKKSNNVLSNIFINTTLFILITPLLTLIVWSFTNSWSWPNIIPKEYSLRGSEFLFTMDNLRALNTSIILSLIISFISVSISIPAGKAFGLYDFKGKKFFELLILAPIIVPTISVAMGIHIVFIQMGIANTILGVVLVNLLPCIPYAVRILSDVYEIVGDKLEMQAKVLGANSINTFIYITLPLIAPGIISAASMCFIISFGQYFLTFLIGGGSVITYPMLMFPYIQSGDRTIASLYSIVFLLVSLIVLIIVESSIKKYYKTNNKTFFI